MSAHIRSIMLPRHLTRTGQSRQGPPSEIDHFGYCCLKDCKTEGVEFVTNQLLLPQKLAIECSPMRLPRDGTLQRQPRHPSRSRPEEFFGAFDAHQLIYDVFWHHDGRRILAVGPAPRNLKSHLKRAEWIALPSGKPLAARLHASLSTMIVELNTVPAGTSQVRLQLGDLEWTAPVRDNLDALTTDAKVLFTMNKNNDLAWIRDWADWHVRLHGTDTIFVFDNGSDRYGIADVEQVLGKVSGLNRFGVIEFRHKFGPIDPSVKLDPFWARFAQISSMSVVLRRLGRHAKGLLNLDIDELANPPGGRSLYDIVEETRHGLLILPGRWVEPNTDAASTGPLSHDAFSFVHRNHKQRESSPVKWIIDPKRRWIDSLDVHPYWHWVRGRPRFGKSFKSGAHFWHFRGVNTGWKVRSRTQPRHNDWDLQIDTELIEARKRLDVVS